MEKLSEKLEPDLLIEQTSQFDVDVNTDTKIEIIEPKEVAAEKPQILIYFVRHGVHIETGADEKKFPLHDDGIEEAREIGKEIRINENQGVGFYVDNLRSLISTTLAINPEAEIPQKEAEKYKERKKLKTLNSLQYRAVNRPIFRERLDEAVKNGTVLRFLVEESDQIAGYDIEELSTYSTISRDIAGIIKKYISVQKNWERLNEVSPREDKNLYRVFCGREFIYACFRAKLTETILGVEERDKFIAWYENDIEDKDEARKEFGTIKLEAGRSKDLKITLTDSFGSLQITSEILDMITSKKLEAIREATYILPTRYNAKTRTKEVAIVEYPDGIGFIGGRVNENETLKQGLAREIKEELGEGKDFLKDIKPLQSIYSIKMKAGDRTGEGEHKEKHYFYLLSVSDKIKLDFKEKGASIIWIPVDKLIERIKYPDLQKFLKENIIPEL